MRFSEYFGLAKTEHDDWFDIDTERDSPYFLDPFLILQDVDPKWQELRESLCLFFEEVSYELASTKGGTSKVAPKILQVAEPAEYRLGIAQQKYRGYGSRRASSVFTGLQNHSHIQGPWDAGVTMSFLRKIGSFDRLSDLTCVALKDPLVRYTQSVADRRGIPMLEQFIKNLHWDHQVKQWSSKAAQIPVGADGFPIVLVPQKYVSSLSAAKGGEFRESEFISFLVQVLERSGIGSVSPEVRLAPGAVADILVATDSTLHLIECKRRVPQTSSRLESSIEQLKHYEGLTNRGRYSGLNQKLVLATPGRLAETHRRYLHENGVTAWDGSWIYQRASQVGLQEEALRYVGYFDGREPAAEQDAHTFEERLLSIPPGRSNWATYQRLCQEIFEYLFCPPLRTPIAESRTENGVNRRDFVLPNYSVSGFWEFLRREYQADYIAVDPKNYAGKIGKERVLQIANYLQRHGLGLFAIIVSRVGADRAAVATIREQWILHDKLIIVLQDADLIQMLTDKAFGNDPVELIRQKIEDFRLGI
ncbi:hypothetical protein ACFT38_11465 [Streptomyces sp. NPDC056975]|uniref:hypothetical protein n=1 Tax=Streptomyces sp. NPDC056975 TaxID=3345985 RepID=UPI003636ED75